MMLGSPRIVQVELEDVRPQEDLEGTATAHRIRFRDDGTMGLVAGALEPGKLVGRLRLRRDRTPERAGLGIIIYCCRAGIGVMWSD